MIINKIKKLLERRVGNCNISYKIGNYYGTPSFLLKKTCGIASKTSDRLSKKISFKKVEYSRDFNELCGEIEKIWDESKYIERYI